LPALPQRPQKFQIQISISSNESLNLCHYIGRRWNKLIFSCTEGLNYPKVKVVAFLL
jgi:hypothetical protein